MYYLPRMPRTRIAAFNDTPEVERYLRRFLSKGATWEALAEDAFVQANLVTGEVHTPEVLEVSGTYVLGDSGVAQIDFHLRPRTLLFAHGPYTYVRSERTRAYRAIEPEPFRWEISALAYSPDEFALGPLYEALASVEKGAATRGEVETVLAALEALRGQLETFRSRRDPISAVLPALSAEATNRETKDRDLQSQISLLQRPEGIGVSFPVDYPTRAHVDQLLSRKVDQGLVEALVASKASQADFDTHVLGRNPHATGYADVGAPSRAELLQLLARFNALLSTVTGAPARVTSLVGEGDVLVRDLGGGQWAVDGSLVAENLTPSRQIEHRFTESGRLYAMSAGRIVGAKLQGNVTVFVEGAPVYEASSEEVVDLPSPANPEVPRDALVAVAFTGEASPTNLLQLRIEEY